MIHIIPRFPQLRTSRLWMIVYSLSRLHAANVSVADAASYLSTTMDLLRTGNESLSLDDALLPETHAVVANYLDGCSRLCGPYSREADGSDWVSKHIDRIGIEAWLAGGSQLLSQEDIEIFPGFNALTLRQTDVLQMKGIKALPCTQAPSIINVGQSLGFATKAMGIVGTITPAGELFHTGRCRLQWICLRDF